MHPRSPAHRLGHARGAGSPQRQRSAGSGFVYSEHTAGCASACGAAAATPLGHASLAHSSAASATRRPRPLSLSPKLQPKKALRCARNALLLDLPLARGSISGLGSRDIQPTPPPLMRPPRSATALPPRLPAPVPSPPSTTRTPASLASCPLRPSTLTLSSHNERRLVFSANGSHHHLDVCRPRCSVHWARTYQRSQTQRYCKRFMPLVTSTLADPAARIYLACRPFRGCHVTVD